MAIDGNWNRGDLSRRALLGRAGVGVGALALYASGFSNEKAWAKPFFKQDPFSPPAQEVLDCAEAFDPSRTMLGAEQESWLLDSLDRSPARWNVLAQQVPIYEDAHVGLPADKGEGYRASRARLIDFLAQREPANPIVVTGDVHFNSVADLKADWEDPDSEVVGSEFVGTSLSSGAIVRRAASTTPIRRIPTSSSRTAASGATCDARSIGRSGAPTTAWSTPSRPGHRESTRSPRSSSRTGDAACSGHRRTR
ncbi:MAG: alkaline phosphatase D family protein [Actinomycetota bacterium]|nr:alkaline phosphatase D family protein [Actinomycetota bacterium]